MRIFLIDFIDESGYHVSVLDVEVVVGTEHVARNYTGELAAVLLVVGSVQDV